MKPKFTDYAIEIRRLTDEEGGGFLATFPDLPGCMADGETPEDAIADARGAFECWMDAHIADGRPVPTPGAANDENLDDLPQSHAGACILPAPVRDGSGLLTSTAACSAVNPGFCANPPA